MPQLSRAVFDLTDSLATSFDRPVHGCETTCTPLRLNLTPHPLALNTQMHTPPPTFVRTPVSQVELPKELAGTSVAILLFLNSVFCNVGPWFITWQDDGLSTVNRPLFATVRMYPLVDGYNVPFLGVCAACTYSTLTSFSGMIDGDVFLKFFIYFIFACWGYPFDVLFVHFHPLPCSDGCFPDFHVMECTFFCRTMFSPLTLFR